MSVSSARSAPRQVPAAETLFCRDVVHGLRCRPRHVPSKYLYDQRGSRLFDRICELDEYYLTRTETQIMSDNAEQIGEQIGTGVTLVEYGSGSSVKTRVLLEHLSELAGYVPVDIACEHLAETCGKLSRDFPALKIVPLCADFMRPLRIPERARLGLRTALYFPGSTIGNLTAAEATCLLRQMTETCGAAGQLLIGIDLQKDASTLEAAYNDAEGVSADFTLNLLRRMRRELDADIDEDGFVHYAFYNDEEARIEIYLRSLRGQRIRIGTQTFHVDAGELIQTEYSHKYTIEGFTRMARWAGWRLRYAWTDEQDYFAVLLLDCDGGAT